MAVDSYLDGARQRAFVIGFFAALDRPELWLFWGPYGLYLFWKDPGARRLVVALFALIPVLWFLPELWGSGHLLRGVTRAQHPRANSAAFTKCPVCTVYEKEAWPTVLNRVKIAGILAMIVAAVGLWRTRASWWRQSPMTPPTRGRMWLLIIGGYGLVWWLIIAFETQAGFSGNDRYLVFGTAAVAIAGGVGWGWAMRSAARGVRWLAERSPRLAGLAAPRVALPIGTAVGDCAVPGRAAVDQQERHQPAPDPSRPRLPGAPARRPERRSGTGGRRTGAAPVRIGDDRGLPGPDGRLDARRSHPARRGRAGRRWPVHRGRT